MYLVDPDNDNPMGGVLNEYAVGKNGDVFEDGSARLIKAGTKIQINGHFHSIGEETPATIMLGLKFYPKGWQPKHEVITQHMGDNNDIFIPANQKDVRFDGYTVLTKPAVVTSFQPHLHNRGKASCIEAIYPGGRVEQIHCARFFFNWHINYVYADQVAPLLPAGTVLG